jgi:hypothetical protein
VMGCWWKTGGRRGGPVTAPLDSDGGASPPRRAEMAEGWMAWREMNFGGGSGV